MTLLEEIPSGALPRRSIPVLETKRLVLRAARLEDAKAVAALANDRRIAENTARIPHPYGWRMPRISSPGRTKTARPCS